MAAPKALRSVAPFVCQSCRQHMRPSALRPFSTTTRRPVDAFGLDLPNTSPTSPGAARRREPNTGSAMLGVLDRSPDNAGDSFGLDGPHEEEQPHRLHVYATKHNTHITLVQPQKSAAKTASSNVSGTSASSTEQKKMVDTLLSISAGNIGFRKAGRGSYDAAFQLAGFALKQMQERGMLRDLKRMEVVLRGFGAGREAVTKALLGVEGRHVRHTITSVKDATRLKQGGPRSKKPRRLG